MDDQIIVDEVVSDELRAKIKTAVKDELTSKEGETLAQEMMEATELAQMAEDNHSGMSRRALIKMQRQAFKMAKRDRRRGTHVQHPQREGRYHKNAIAYYGNVGNLRMNVKTANEYIEADLFEVDTCSVL